MKSKLISLKDYSAKQGLPLTLEDILIRQVQKEDWINHANELVPELPKYEKKKIKFTTATAYAFSRNFLKVMMP